MRSSHNPTPRDAASTDALPLCCRIGVSDSDYRDRIELRGYPVHGRFPDPPGCTRESRMTSRTAAGTSQSRSAPEPGGPQLQALARRGWKPGRETVHRVGARQFTGDAHARTVGRPASPPAGYHHPSLPTNPRSGVHHEANRTFSALWLLAVKAGSGSSRNRCGARVALPRRPERTWRPCLLTANTGPCSPIPVQGSRELERTRTTAARAVHASGLLTALDRQLGPTWDCLAAYAGHGGRSA
jgi:hypothetical protein